MRTGTFRAVAVRTSANAEVLSPHNEELLAQPYSSLPNGRGILEQGTLSS
ncbi:MAG: hypothetical protein IPG10_02160 [Flavobacteriales bacterium]|nr:hypothetical protein [Flavobacteriales bacterium]